MQICVFHSVLPIEIDVCTVPPLTPRFGGPSYTIWRPSVQFKS